MNASLASAKRGLKIAIGLLFGLFLLLLLTRSGLPMLAVLLMAMLPTFMGLRAAMRRARAAQGPAPGAASSVMSEWLEMRLDHDSGAFSGIVRRGALAGRELDDLTEPELDRLALECRGDDQSARLLAAYIARRFGRPETDEPGETAGDTSGASGGMSRAEALDILGLEEGADAAAVNLAYKRLIAHAHPDRGGSAYLAAKINEAREVLLSGR